MEDTNANRKLTCILFPGVVKNEEKAISNFGGIREISHIYSQSKKKRLALSFQPDNPYVKKVYGDEIKSSGGVVLKVRVKKSRVNNEVKREVVSSSIVGRVTTIYKFDSLCDFQYLPLHREGDGPLQCILEKILLSGVDDFSVMSEPAPSFIVPTSFTRSDRPIPYSYNDRRYVNVNKKKYVDDGEQNHHRVRKDRKLPGTKISFNLVDDWPTEPHEEFLSIKEDAIKELQDEYNVIKKLFDEKPIWTQNSIKYRTKIKYASLKVLMPCFGVCMSNGPWRMTWVRYGYDPRKDPAARFYQTLDFRVRHQSGIYTMVKSQSRITKQASRIKFEADSSKTEPKSEEIGEAHVIFRAGMVPAQRQTFYQYCDIKIPEVEAILGQEPPPGYLCHQKRGWLPPNTDEICRDHIFKHIKNTLLTTHGTDLKIEGSSSDDGTNSDDDADEGSSSTDEPSLADEPSTSSTKLSKS